jgi:hypothetical protein
MDYPLMFESIQDKPWAIFPPKLTEITLLVEGVLGGKQIDFAAAARGRNGNRAADPPYQMLAGGVALISVYGILAKRMNLFSDFSGGTSNCWRPWPILKSRPSCWISTLPGAR